jgi:hypothetical protein
MAKITKAAIQEQQRIAREKKWEEESAKAAEQNKYE